MNVTEQIMALENELRDAELAPDPAVFDRLLDDKALIDGRYAKQMILDAHQPGRNPKFTRVEMGGYEIIAHGDTVVLACNGTYESGKGAFTLRFMRVWARKDGRWKIVAGSVLPAPQAASA